MAFLYEFSQSDAATRRDTYPLPRIDETLDSLAHAVMFTTLDLASGYWQVELDEASKEKTLSQHQEAITSSTSCLLVSPMPLPPSSV